jgi:hypothetical protein
MPEAVRDGLAPAHLRRLSASRAPVSNARLSARLARELSLPEESLQVWPSVEFALREIVSALRARDLEQAGMRDLVVIGSQQDPSIDRCVIPSLSCEVVGWNPSGETPFRDFDPGRALAIVTAMDDRWSGRIYRAPDELKALRDVGKPWSRVPWLRVGFDLPRYINLSASLPYDIQIIQAGRSGEALVISGDRVRTEVSFAELVVIEGDAFSEFVAWMRDRDAASWPEDARLIERFEAQLPEPFQPFFSDASEARLWNRASIWSPRHHALSIVAKLKSMGASEDEVWSWQACSLDDYRLEEWLLRREGMSPLGRPERLRGGLQISASCLRRLTLEVCWEVLRGGS